MVDFASDGFAANRAVQPTRPGTFAPALGIDARGGRDSACPRLGMAYESRARRDRSIPPRGERSWQTHYPKRC